MKAFWIYTALRALLFLGAFGIVFGVWALLADEVPLLWTIILAFVLSGLGSYVLLDRQREEFARRVDERARTASRRLEEIRSKEDAD